MNTVPDTHLEQRLPPHAPCFLCPLCQCTLHYVGSRNPIGHNEPIESSDYYTCPEGCGTFERDRVTHRLRSLAL